MTKEEALKKKYGFSMGDHKYVLSGGEIFKYVGQEVVLVEFTKNEETNDWENTIRGVTLKSVSNFDLPTMTWVCKYQDGEEEKEVKIIPEAFSFEEKGLDESKHMIHLISYSKHYEMMQDSQFFTRLEELWGKKEMLSKETLSAYNKMKVPEAVLGYTHNIGALVKLNDDLYNKDRGESGFLWIRITKQLSFHHTSGDKFRLMFVNDDRSWSSVIDLSSGEKEYDFEGMGKFKIIDLSD